MMVGYPLQQVKPTGRTARLPGIDAVRSLSRLLVRRHFSKHEEFR